MLTMVVSCLVEVDELPFVATDDDLFWTLSILSAAWNNDLRADLRAVAPVLQEAMYLTVLSS